MTALNLAKALRTLKSTDQDGFEGLIARLLSHLTGRRCYLARSTNQHGRDMSSDRQGDTVIAVECKRYGKNTELKERELVAEIHQAAADIPDLDIWLLVSSRSVPDQLVTMLTGIGSEKGIDFQAICFEDGSPSSLEVLCAFGSDIVTGTLQEIVTDSERIAVEKELGRIANVQNFPRAIQYLREGFSGAWTGYDQWRFAQNKWLFDCFQNEDSSRAAFHQPLNVGNADIGLVERHGIWNVLDDWLITWKAEPRPLILLGEEGDGKTWGVASWLNREIRAAKEGPPIIFLASHNINKFEPLSLLADTITQILKTKDQVQWEKRLSRWQQRAKYAGPLLILVLDGINERGSCQRWRKLLEALAVDRWPTQVAVIVTARASYWGRYFAPLRHFDVKSWTVSPYSDDELDIALKHHDVARSDISDKLLPLIRKPRYLDLVLKHRKAVEHSGDMTVARLVYEDWRDRWQRKTNLPIDDQAFQSLMMDLAEQARNKTKRLSENYVSDLTTTAEDKQATLNELVSGGVLEGKLGAFRVVESRLILGFGLLLAAYVEQCLSEEHEDIDESIAQWLEPHREMDLKARICESAALHAMDSSGFSETSRLTLLKAWVDSKNPSESIEQSFIAYMPLWPAGYMQLAEHVWSESAANPWGEQLIMDALLRWQDSQSVASLLPDTFARWLGFIHPEGHPFQRLDGEGREGLETVRAQISSQLGRDPKPRSIRVAGYPLTVIEDDGLLRLGRVALAIISHLPRKPFIRAITIGCLAEVAMGPPAKYDLFSWVVRSAKEPMWLEIQKEVERLLTHDHVLTKRTAYRLLSFEGSENARSLQRSLPNNLFSPNPLRILHERDPCLSIAAWQQKDLEHCLGRADLPPTFLASRLQLLCRDPELSVPSDLGERLANATDEIPVNAVWVTDGPTSEDHLLEKIEPALCVYAPRAIAEVYRSIANTVEERISTSLRRLAIFELGNHELVYDENTLARIRDKWNYLRKRYDELSKNERMIEIYLFDVLLGCLEPAQQLASILQRPADAIDPTRFEHKFKKISDWTSIRNILTKSETQTVRRTLWFLASHPKAIPEDIIFDISALLTNADSHIRAWVLKILYLTGSGEHGRKLTKISWAWDRNHCDWENHWGSLLLARFFLEMPYTELKCRIHPTYLGFAVVCRGTKEDELQTYADDIEQLFYVIIREISSGEIPDDFPATELNADIRVSDIPFEQINLSKRSTISLRFVNPDSIWGGLVESGGMQDFEDPLTPSYLEKKNRLWKIVREKVDQQIQAGNVWFSRRFSTHALKEVASNYPKLVTKWLTFLQDLNPQNADQILFKARSFYESLCEVLLDVEPNVGIKLFRRLQEHMPAINIIDGQTRIPLLRYALFRATPIPQIECAWDQCLEECKTDQELLELVIVARAGMGKTWLLHKIKHDERYNVVYLTARMITLRGLVASDDSAEWFSARIKQEPETWLDTVAEKAYQYYQTDRWAKHWFSQFLTAEDKIHAWAAFRLLLQCVDRRFWLWQSSVQDGIDGNDYDQRIMFLKTNLDTLRNSIKKNEKPMAEQFLASKVLEKQVWPWM